MYPWYCNDEVENCYRYYSQLRSSLFPYICFYAHVANETSLAILLPFALTYTDTDRYDKITNEFMFGDSLLISAFNTHLILPEENDWYDFYTGKLYTGPREFDYTLPKERGGAIFVKADSIIVMQDWANSLCNYNPDTLTIHIYGGRDATFTLYEDDYTTYAYEKGKVAKTVLTYRESDGSLNIGKRTGSYAGMKAEKKFKVVQHFPDGSVC